MDKRCEKCVLRYIKKVENLFNLYNNSAYIEEMAVYKENVSKYETSSDFHQDINRVFIKYLGNKDYFKEKKQALNQKVEKQFGKLRKEIFSNSNFFEQAILYSIGGNKLDLAQGKDIEDIEIYFNVPIDKNVVYYLKQRIEKGENLLILGDNAGEIVLDMLLVEAIKKINPNMKIEYFVRSEPFLNDTIIDDLDEFLLSQPVSYKPFMLKDAKQLKELDIYDIIISKGQANLERYYPLRDDRFYFLFVIKCEVIAEMIGKKEGDFVIMGGKNV